MKQKSEIINSQSSGKESIRSPRHIKKMNISIKENVKYKIKSGAEDKNKSRTTRPLLKHKEQVCV